MVLARVGAMLVNEDFLELIGDPDNIRIESTDGFLLLFRKHWSAMRRMPDQMWYWIDSLLQFPIKFSN